MIQDVIVHDLKAQGVMVHDKMVHDVMAQGIVCIYDLLFKASVKLYIM